MFSSVINWFSSAFSTLSYFDITLLMTLENSFIPIPSELIMLPAGYLAATGKISLFGAILSSTFGTLLGATINYLLARHLGRRVIHKLADRPWAKWLLIDSAKLAQAEDYYRERGRLSTFLGRLVPVVRQFISIPAGLAKMNIWHFWLYTALGAGLWCSFLTTVGYFFGSYQNQIINYLNQITNITILFIVATIIYLIIKHVRRN
jgi:membrane protein DedA with SNARE-associated domain